MKLLIIITIFHISLFSQDLKRNIDIIDSLANLSYENLLDSLASKNTIKFIPDFNDPPVYFKSIFISKMYELDFEIAGDSIDINILKYKPKYITENDSVLREINFLLSSNYLGILESNSFKDKISEDDIIYVEDSEFQFDKAILRKSKSSFWDKYLEPIILIGSTLVSVLLLFTVRSS